MKKLLRTTFAIILALTMCLSSGIMAMAQDNSILGTINMATIPTFAVASDSATLKTAINSNVELIIITNNITINETITINHDITFAAASETFITSNGYLTVTGGNISLTFQEVGISGGIYAGINSTANLLTINDGNFSGGQNAVYATGNLTINGGTYSNCSTAIYCTATFTLEDGIIENNYSLVGGAGIYSTGTVNIKGGQIRSNMAAYKSSCSGGGIWIIGGTLNISGGVIRDNSVSGTGGGIRISNGTLNMTGGAILYNSSSGYKGGSGGGISASSCTLILNGGLIVGNTATTDITGTSVISSGISASDCTVYSNGACIIYDNCYGITF